MGKSMMMASKIASVNTATSTTLYYIIGNAICGTDQLSATEINVQVPYYTPGIISYFSVNMFSNARSGVVFRIRKNGANGNSAIALSANQTGIVWDASNTDTIASGDKINASFFSGTGGANCRPSVIGAVFTPKILSKTLSKYVCYKADGGPAYTTTSTTHFSALSGETNISVNEPGNQSVFQVHSTISNLATYVSANSRNDTCTLQSRKNAAFGNLTISIGAGLTGLFTDLTHSDSATIGDKFNYAFTTGSGSGSITPQFYSVESVTASNRQQQFCASVSAAVAGNIVTSIPWGSYFGATVSLANAVTFANWLDCNFRFLNIMVTANTLSKAATFENIFLVGGPGLSISIPAATTGVFSDLTGWNENIGYDGNVIPCSAKFTTGNAGTTGSITVATRGVVIETFPTANSFGAGA